MVAAAKQMEAAQRALRKTDYDSDTDEEEMNSELNPLSPSIRQRGSRSTVPKNSTFDPYAPLPPQPTPQPTPTLDSAQDQEQQESLFDATAFELSSMIADNELRSSSSQVPGGAGYLEIEEEPPRSSILDKEQYHDDPPITTTSGLLLTHRKSPPPVKNRKGSSSNPKRNFEVEYGNNYDTRRSSGLPPPSYPYRNQGTAIAQAKRLFSYVKLWMVVCFFVLLVSTAVFLHSFKHHPRNEVVSKTNQNNNMYYNQQDNNNNYYSNDNQNYNNNVNNMGGKTMDYNNNVYNSENNFQQKGQILLVPMDGISQMNQQQQQQIEPPRRRQLAFTHPEHLSSKHSHYHHNTQHSHHHHGGIQGSVEHLRDEFESWISEHKILYHSAEEKEHRFHIWTSNHHRTIEKNRRHGPCKLTKQTVFGSNKFKDLDPEEFKGKYLTGYNGPRTDKLHHPQMQMPFDPRLLNNNNNKSHSAKVLDPNVQKINVHETVKQRMLQQQYPVQATSTTNQCNWYDVSCILRWVYNSSGMQFGLIGTMEPKYDADAYPNAVDWRSLGAVTDVRYQGDCGGCWAITAVETIESAHFISTGNLYDLSEAEIITCETNCQMCDGGWPQNAFQWTMDHGGLPLSSNFAYDASTLYKMTLGLSGQSNVWTEDSISAYRDQVCPVDSNNKDNSHDSQDYYEGGDNKNYGDYSSKGRYGNIKGFGYATERCVCYTDGSGCDCDDQNENTAVRNVASYGPAVVCLEASLWQDYSGGIITSDLGCGNTFMDMNHCVQAVGYAFTEGFDDDGEDKKSGGSQDGQREGYWIIRNQWGSNWGMNGYAYVAMGDNTCGVLNDMTQAYL